MPEAGDETSTLGRRGMAVGRRVLWVALSLAILLVVLEVLFRLVFSSDWVVRTIASHGGDDSSWRLLWANRHEGGATITYDFDIHDPTKGWISKAGLQNAVVFDDRRLNTNSYGFRGATEVPFARHAGIFRIVVLGDSFTFGDEVSDHETYAHVLEDLLPDTEVINLGVHGYGHDQMLIVLHEIGIRYQPDVVVVGFVYDDIYRNDLTFRDYAKPRFLQGDTGLHLDNSPVPPPERLMAEEWKRLKILDAAHMVKTRLETLTGSHERRVRSLTARILKEIAITSSAAGALPVMSYLPVTEELVDFELARQHEAFLEDFCASSDHAECASTLPYFQEAMQRGVAFRHQGHWTVQGHRTVAEGLRRFLLSKFPELAREP